MWAYPVSLDTGVGGYTKPKFTPVGSSSPVPGLHMATPWCSQCSALFLQAEVLAASLGYMDWGSQGLLEAGANAEVQKIQTFTSSHYGIYSEIKAEKASGWPVGRAQSKVEGQEKKTY